MKRIACIILILCLSGCAAPTPTDAPETPAPSPAPAAATAAPTPTATPTASPTPVPVAITLYLPDASGEGLVRVEGTIGEDTPVAIIDELVRREALPDVDYGRNLFFTVGDSFIKVKNRTRKPSVVARLDTSDAFLRALEAMSATQEQVVLQCIANTFIDHYDAEVCMITVSGDKLETYVHDYEKGIAFDQYARTRKD